MGRPQSGSVLGQLLEGHYGRGSFLNPYAVQVRPQEVVLQVIEQRLGLLLELYFLSQGSRAPQAFLEQSKDQQTENGKETDHKDDLKQGKSPSHRGNSETRVTWVV